MPFAPSIFLLLLVRHLLLLAWHLLLVASLLLVVRPGAPFVASLFLVVRPGAPFVASLFLVVMPGATSSFMLLVVMISNLVASNDLHHDDDLTSPLDTWVQSVYPHDLQKVSDVRGLLERRSIFKHIQTMQRNSNLLLFFFLSCSFSLCFTKLCFITVLFLRPPGFLSERPQYLSGPTLPNRLSSVLLRRRVSRRSEERSLRHLFLIAMHLLLRS